MIFFQGKQASSKFGFIKKTKNKRYIDFGEKIELPVQVLDGNKY